MDPLHSYITAEQGNTVYLETFSKHFRRRYDAFYCQKNPKTSASWGKKNFKILNVDKGIGTILIVQHKTTINKTKSFQTE